MQRDTTWASGLPCAELVLVLVDAFTTGGQVAQRMAGEDYDVDASDNEVRDAIASAICREWAAMEVFY